LNFLARGHRGLGLICALLLASLVALPILTKAAGSNEDLTKADWSVNALHDLAHNPPSEEAVRSFLRNVPNSVGGITNQVCDIQFADLKHNGTLSLVLGDDGGGTADCNYSEIFDKSGGRIEEYFQDAYIGNPSVEDINGDGHFEVIVDDTAAREFVGHYDASAKHPYIEICCSCEEIWPRVYAWTGSGYTEVSSQYPKYYERELESVKKQIAAIDEFEASPKVSASGARAPAQSAPGFSMEAHWSSGTVDGSRTGQEQNQQILREPSAGALPAPEAAAPPNENALDCLKAEAAKIERFVGGPRDAGMNDAIRWANSNDPEERKFASDVLPEIGTTEAQRYERTLARDSNPNVAGSATEELKHWGEPEKASGFERSP